MVILTSVGEVKMEIKEIKDIPMCSPVLGFDILAWEPRFWTKKFQGQFLSLFILIYILELTGFTRVWMSCALMDPPCMHLSPE